MGRGISSPSIGTTFIVKWAGSRSCLVYWLKKNMHASQQTTVYNNLTCVFCRWPLISIKTGWKLSLLVATHPHPLHRTHARTNTNTYTRVRTHTHTRAARKESSGYGISLDLTYDRLALLKEARKKVENVDGINFAYSDINTKSYMTLITTGFAATDNENAYACNTLHRTHARTNTNTYTRVRTHTHTRARTRTPTYIDTQSKMNWK